MCEHVFRSCKIRTTAWWYILTTCRTSWGIKVIGSRSYSGKCRFCYLDISLTWIYLARSRLFQGQGILRSRLFQDQIISVIFYRKCGSELILGISYQHCPERLLYNDKLQKSSIDGSPPYLSKGLLLSPQIK